MWESLSNLERYYYVSSYTQCWANVENDQSDIVSRQIQVVSLNFASAISNSTAVGYRRGAFFRRPLIFTFLILLLSAKLKTGPRTFATLEGCFCLIVVAHGT